jgi:ribokinase
MAGAVGNDDFGRFLLDALVTGGVDASCVEQLDGVGSGMSVAISDASGDYGADIVSGANLYSDATSMVPLSSGRTPKSLSYKTKYLKS